MKTVVKFSAAWCGPCRMMKPIFEKVAKNHEKDENLEFKEINLDGDDADEISEKYQIRNVPTFLILNNGSEYARQTGARNEQSFEDWIKRNI